jgi:hypothetical protein
MTGFIINANDVVRNTPVRGSVDTDIINAAIKRTQETVVVNLLGYRLTKKLVEIKDNQTSGDYLDLINEYVGPYMEWAVADALIYDIQFSMGQSGIVQSTGDQGSAIFEGLTATLKNTIRQYKNMYKDLMLKFICHENSKFPEFNEIENGKPSASKDNRPFNGVQFY